MAGGECGGSRIEGGGGKGVRRCDIFLLPKYVDGSVNPDVFGL